MSDPVLIGTVREMRATVRDRSGTPATPSSMTLHVRAPKSTSAEAVSLEPVLDSVNDIVWWVGEVTCSIDGEWVARWTSLNPDAVLEESWFVRPSRVL